MTILLILTTFIFLSYYLLFIRLKVDSTHQKIILAGLGGFGQIILTQLFLGVIGLLYLPFLIFLNIAIILIIVLSSRVFKKNVRLTLQLEYQKIVGGVRNAVTFENVFLLVLFGFVFIWMVTAIYFFPPRSGDDLKYHLPPIFEYIINHKICLLPVEINKRFAFPENAELLFMWPTIFLHSQQFVNSVQLIVSLFGGAIIYGLARLQGIRSKISLFVSLLFLMTPVVMSQMGACYIDITVSVFTLAVFYCAAMFYKSRDLMYFYSTALTAGLLWGMRYNECLFILMLMPFLFSKNQIHPRRWVGFIIIFLIAGGFWYFRNLLVLNTPIYPMPFSNDSLSIYSAHSENVTLGGFVIRIPCKLLLLWKDIGLGSLHGGYGLIFWGIALPAWFYIWAKSIIQRKRLDFWLYSLLIIGVGQLMLVSLEDYIWIARYSIFIVAIGLIALGEVLIIFDQIVSFQKGIKILCVVFTILAVVHLSENSPTYRIDKIIKIFLDGKYLTQQDYGHRATAFGVLDYLTMNDPRPLNCDVMIMFHSYFVSAVYGTKLQNKMWAFQQDKSVKPDVFIFLRGLNEAIWPDDLDLKITLKKMRIDSDYFLVFQSLHSFLYIRKDFFKDQQKKWLLNNYYRNSMEAASLPAS